MTKSRWAGLAFGVLLILAAAGLVLWQGVSSTSAGTAFAQTAPTPTATATATPTKPLKTPVTQRPRNESETAFWKALAAKLGMSVDTLQSAFVAVEKDSIEQAVKEGKLTRAQADLIEKGLSANDMKGFAPFLPDMRGGIGMGGFRIESSFDLSEVPSGGVNTLEAVANVLNMKPADLTAQLRSGKTLADIAKAQKVDEGKVKQAIIDADKAEIQRELQDGVLTQAQADQLLSRLTPDKIDLSRMRGFGGWVWR